MKKNNTVGSTTEHAIRWISQPLDSLRRQILHYFSPWLRPFIRNRSLRICVTASSFIFLAFVFSIALPLWQLLLGPILLGIPHFVSDIRYLIVRKGLHKQVIFWFGVALPLACFLLAQKPVYAMSGVLVASLCSLRPKKEKYLAIAICSLLTALSWVFPRNFIFMFLHLHNVIGIAIWWFWRKRDRYEGIPLLLCLLGCLFILFFPISLSSAQEVHPPNLNNHYFERSIAPFAPTIWQFRLVTLYAFLQSIHYLVWIRLIPEEAKKKPTPQSFTKSFLSLKEDMGSIFFVSIFVAAGALLLYAVYSPQDARYHYLYLISFHGFLELAFCAYTRVQQ